MSRRGSPARASSRSRAEYRWFQGRPVERTEAQARVVPMIRVDARASAKK